MVRSSNLLDRAIAYFAPEAAWRREMARMGLDIVAQRTRSLRGYEAAGRGRRLQDWNPKNLGANAEVSPALDRVRARCRDLVRNNTLAARAVRVVNSNTVGTGIMSTPMLEEGIEKKVLQDLWTNWAETTECDARGRANIYGLQSLAMRCLSECGEVLFLRKRKKASDGLTVPLQVMLLEPDYIDTQRNEVKGGRETIQGVEIDENGKATGYWLFPRHPGEQSWLRAHQGESIRYDASDVIHLYREDRIGQLRGVPHGAVCVVDIRDTNDMRDAVLFRAKIASCFVGFWHAIPGMEELAEKAAVEADEDDPSIEIEKFEPGTIKRAPPGHDMTFSNPPGIDGFEVLMKVNLRQIAAAWDITYQALTGDLESVNFSSGRMGWIDMWNAMEQLRWNCFLPQGMDPLYRWFTNAAYTTGRVRSPFTRSEWTPPKREMLDPTKEIPAITKGVRAGFTSLSEAIRESGRNPRKVLEELASDYMLADQLGLQLESDPKHGKAVGEASQKSPGNTPKKGGGKGAEDDEDEDGS